MQWVRFTWSINLLLYFKWSTNRLYTFNDLFYLSKWPSSQIMVPYDCNDVMNTLIKSAFGKTGIGKNNFRRFFYWHNPLNRNGTLRSEISFLSALGVLPSSISLISRLKWLRILIQCQCYAAPSNLKWLVEDTRFFLNRNKQTAKIVFPINIWIPWNPVAIKNIAP